MANAVIDLDNSTKSNKVSKDIIRLQKQVWNNFFYQDNKINKEYKYCQNKTMMNIDKSIFDMLKSNRDITITKYKEENNDDDLTLLYN